MAKKERGLPSTFDLRVPEPPVQLGDYLDEEMPPEPPPKPPDPYAVPGFQRPYPHEPVRAPLPPMRPPAVPRKQVNMSPETLRMIDEMLAQVRTYSMEKDVRTSELFHALVLCVYEARAALDLSGVPPRGRWGSPTAAALPVALKNAFQEAIVRTRLQKK